MCIALPGKVLEIDETGLVGKVDFQGNIIGVTMGAVDAKVGDNVLVHAGSAIEVVDDAYAAEIMSLFAEIVAAYEAEDAAKDGAKDRAESAKVYPLFQGDDQR